MSNTPVYIVLLGAPGSGKGTQARLMIEALQLPQVASGDLFRDNITRKTPLGVLAQTYINQGMLVPDDLTIEMVQSRLAEPDCAQGAILDGFPRTLEQGISLKKSLAKAGHAISCVMYIEVEPDSLIERLSGRLICRNCQATYHLVFNPPKASGVCDVCGGELYQRPDDTIETAKKRLVVYFEQTMPLINWFAEQGQLKKINGNQSIEDVQRDILVAVCYINL